MRITVTDFQSLGHVDLDVAGLTVLVGPSSRGKSALIRAVEAVLFNKPGDEFVRVGKKKAVVEISGLPGGVDVSWTKGGGKTVYFVNGEVFNKVGQGTPPALTEAGYRDIWIGDKDRKKGEWLRPQVSAQHDPIFLLTRSGSFVSDVLGAISRHAVLLTAQGRATGDQRSTKQQHGYKQTDLTAAQAQLDALADVPALVGRVEALRGAYAARDALATTVDRVKSMLAWRTMYVPVATCTLPAAALTTDMGFLDQSLQALTRSRQLAAARPTRLALGTSEMPPTTDVQPAEAALGTFAKARGLLGHRPHVAALAACQPALDPTPVTSALDQSQALYQSVAAVATKRVQALDLLRRCETAVTSTKVEVDEAQAELATLFDELNVLGECPTCGQTVERWSDE